MSVRRDRSLAFAAAALVLARGVMACTDGVTPDCTNASVCSPIEGDAGPLPPEDGGAGQDARTLDATDASDAADADGG